MEDDAKLTRTESEVMDPYKTLFQINLTTELIERIFQNWQFYIGNTSDTNQRISYFLGWLEFQFEKNTVCEGDTDSNYYTWLGICRRNLCGISLKTENLAFWKLLQCPENSYLVSLTFVMSQGPPYGYGFSKFGFWPVIQALLI